MVDYNLNYGGVDAASEFAKGRQLAEGIRNTPLERQKLESQTQAAQIKAASDKLDVIGNLISNVKDQDSYSMAINTLAQNGVIKPNEVPAQYDPNYVAMHRNSVAHAKNELDKQFKLAEITQMQAGGSTGTLLNRLQNEPGLMDTYLGKANAGKGVVMQGGEAAVVPGYNQAVASTEGAKKSAEQQAVLGTAADIESQKTLGAAAGKSLGEQQKRALNAPNNLMLIKQAETLLPQATSGLAGHAARGLANTFGVSTPSSQADRQLNVLSAALTAGVPRMEGPQSDKDVAMYKQAAGDVGNPDVPYKDRLAALNTMKDLQVKYQELNAPKESVVEIPESSVPTDVQRQSNLARVTPKQIGSLNTKDPRIAAALNHGYTPEEVAAYLGGLR